MLESEKEEDLSKISESVRLKYRQKWNELIHYEIETHRRNQLHKTEEDTDDECELCTETSLKRDQEEDYNPIEKEHIDLTTDVSESKDKLAAVNKLNDQRDLFVEGFLKNTRTLGIVN